MSGFNFVFIEELVTCKVSLIVQILNLVLCCALKTQMIERKERI